MLCHWFTNNTYISGEPTIPEGSPMRTYHNVSLRDYLDEVYPVLGDPTTTSRAREDTLSQYFLSVFRSLLPSLANNSDAEILKMYLDGSNNATFDEKVDIFRTNPF